MVWKEIEDKLKPEQPRSTPKQITRRRLLIGSFTSVVALASSCSIGSSCAAQDIGHEIAIKENSMSWAIATKIPREDRSSIVRYNDLNKTFAELGYLYIRRLSLMVGAAITIGIALGAGFFARKIEREDKNVT